MMTRRSLLVSLFLLGTLLLAACGGQATAQPTIGAVPPAAQTDPSGPGDSPAAPEATLAAAPVGGPGSFNLPQPKAQVEVLRRYHAELVTQFTGEQNGQPLEQTMHLALDWAGSDAQSTRLETSATNAEPIFILAGQVGDTHFLQTSPGGPCTSQNDSLETEPATFGNPWAELPAVYGAELVGSENVNGFETQHYRFDQRAIRWAGSSTAQGDVWVAEAGGFLVRYSLTMQAPTGILGAEVAGQQTWQFDLTPLPEDLNLLPEGCEPVLSDFPILPDASDTLRMPAYLKYTTRTDLAAAADFYRQELTAAGWEEKDAFNATPERTVLFFVRPVINRETSTQQEVATITLRPGETGLRVDVQVVRMEIQP